MISGNWKTEAEIKSHMKFTFSSENKRKEAVTTWARDYHAGWLIGARGNDFWGKGPEPRPTHVLLFSFSFFFFLFLVFATARYCPQRKKRGPHRARISVRFGNVFFFCFFFFFAKWLLLMITSVEMQRCKKTGTNALQNALSVCIPFLDFLIPVSRPSPPPPLGQSLGSLT